MANAHHHWQVTETDPTDDSKEDPYQRQTRLIHGKMESTHWRYSEHIVPPMSCSAAYRLGSAARGAEGFTEFANAQVQRDQHAPIYVYDRLDEPSRGMLEENLALSEAGEVCVTFATGMAAISAALGVLLQSGDTLVTHHTVYGCTYSLFTHWFPRMGIRVLCCDLTDMDELQRIVAREPTVRVVYGESPCNPSLELLDLKAIAGVVSEANHDRAPEQRISSVVDNTFATPFCQRPIEHGIDIVVHSLTKNIGGFGTDMGGAVIGPREIEPDLLLYRKDFGGVLSPKSAWPTLVYGLPTLAVRSHQQIETAFEIAQFLEAHPKVERVFYPGLPSHPQYELAKTQMRNFDGEFAPGIMLYFTLQGAAREARERGSRFIDEVAEKALAVTLAVSLGQVRTLIEHPASMTHAALPEEAQAEAGIDPGGIRLSIGLESPKDIMVDLENALRVI